MIKVMKFSFKIKKLLFFCIQAVADAERQKAVLEITIQERIIEKEGAKNVSLINNEIKKAAENNEADIAKYKLEKVKYFTSFKTILYQPFH